MRKTFKRWFVKTKLKVSRYKNRLILLRIANLPIEDTVRLSGDEKALMEKFVETAKGSPLVTRKGKTVFMLKAVEDMELWDVLETRRAEDAKGRIKAWTRGEFEPKVLNDLVKADKYVTDSLKFADELEEAIFRGIHRGGGSDESSDDPIKQAENLLGLVQLVSELFRCTFEEAKRMNYTDAMLAIAKRSREIEKQKQELKKQQRR